MDGQENLQDQKFPRGLHPRMHSVTTIGLACGFVAAMAVLGLDHDQAENSSIDPTETQVWSQPIEFLSLGRFESVKADRGESHGTLGIDPRGTPFVAFWRDRLGQTPPRVLNGYLSKPDLWKAEILPILASHGVPPEFLYLALLESGMNPEAQSPAQAVGLWQFTDATARRYGLVIDDEVDERLDQLRSTGAAARYLRDLHKQFGSWELAAAAYNAGPGRVRRALAKTGAESYWDLIEVGHLPAETRAYVPRFLALVELAADRPPVPTTSFAVATD